MDDRNKVIAGVNVGRLRTKTQIADKIYQIQYINQKDMSASFGRFIEYWENPVLMGKIFSWQDVSDWYIENTERGQKTGKFLYYDEYEGFAVPSSVMKPFYAGCFSSLKIGEQDLLDQFESIREEDFYIIATYDRSESETEDHEIAHAFYNLYPDYRKQALSILRTIDPIIRIKLNKWHEAEVHPKRWLDETQAYLATDYDHLKQAGVKKRHMRKVASKLEDLFIDFYNAHIY